MLGFFHFVLNSSPLTRDVTCSVSLLGGNIMRRQCQINTLKRQTLETETLASLKMFDCWGVRDNHLPIPSY